MFALWRKSFGVISIHMFSQHAQTETRNKQREINQIKVKSYKDYLDNETKARNDKNYYVHT